MNPQRSKTASAASGNDIPEQFTHPTTSGEFRRKNYGPRGITSEQEEQRERVNEQNEALIEQFRQAELRQARQAAAVSQAAATPSYSYSKKGVEAARLTNPLRRGSITWIGSIHLFLYTTLQLPLVLYGLVFLGTAYVTESTLFGRAFSTVAKAANSVTSLVGLDLSILSPMALFLSIHAILMGIMLFALLFTIFFYAITLHKPFSGTATSAKIGALLIAVLGYSVPVANIFPWVALYILVMWRYPR